MNAGKPAESCLELIDSPGTNMDHKTTKRSFPQGTAEKDLRLTEHVGLAINAEVFHPNDNFVCGICGYREMCREW